MVTSIIVVECILTELVWDAQDNAHDTLEAQPVTSDIPEAGRWI